MNCRCVSTREIMAVSRYSVPSAQVARRIQLRLAGDAGQSASDVAWGDYRGTLIIHLSTLKLRAAEGWLLCNRDMKELSQPACTLQFLFRTARGEEVDPLVVA